MRKYFVASAIAIAVFAMTAFAASLTVDGGVLQAGSDLDLTCADTADVSYSTVSNGDGTFSVDGLTVTFATGCDNHFASVAVLDGGGVETGFGVKEILSNTVAFTVDATDANADVARIDSVSVLVSNTDASGGTGSFSGILSL